VEEVSGTLLRRAGVAGAVAGGLALMGTGVQGIAGIDDRLETAVKKHPDAHKPAERHGCPLRERLRRSPEL
jgi:hypothetical protein